MVNGLLVSGALGFGFLISTAVDHFVLSFSTHVQFRSRKAGEVGAVMASLAVKTGVADKVMVNCLMIAAYWSFHKLAHTFSF